MTIIPFNRPCWTGKEADYISESIASGWISGDGPFTKKVQNKLKDYMGENSEVLLTTSCTHALETAAILLDLKPGDEVIVPSYTFVSTALAFLMHGATPVFVDIRSDTLNIDEELIEASITDKTKAIIPVHYAGVACEMNKIMALAEKYNLTVIEDNAHGLCGKYYGKFLGGLGHMAAQSFHETKNVTCGEGGAIVINSHEYYEKAEIIQEKGTDRAKFFRGEIDKYSWKSKGSSYVMSDILAAFLYGQITHLYEIQAKREAIWNNYDEALRSWAKEHGVLQPYIPEHCSQAFHMYYLIMPDIDTRTQFIKYLKEKNIGTAFHYVPLHSSTMGEEYCVTRHPMDNTNSISDRLVRLPFFNDFGKELQDQTLSEILQFS